MVGWATAVTRAARLGLHWCYEPGEVPNAEGDGTILGRSDHALSFGVDDDLAILLGEGADVRVFENIEHQFRRPA